MATNATPNLHDTVPEDIDPSQTQIQAAGLPQRAFLDFTGSDTKAGMKEALRIVEHELGREYPLDPRR